MELDKQKHVKLLLMSLKAVPAGYKSLDSSRMMLLYFCVSGLDVLESLDALSQDRKLEIIEWIYSQQFSTSGHNGEEIVGFRGSDYLGFGAESEVVEEGQPMYHHPHITMTYSAISALCVLGDDLQRLDKVGILKTIRVQQHEDGGVSATYDGSEKDTRFVYCACSIIRMLGGDWSHFDSKAAEDYILSCQSHEYAFGLTPGREAHGGSTYCALASLSMLGALHKVPNIEDALEYCLYRQGDGFFEGQKGFHGRPGKIPDSCYSWWWGASIALLGGLKHAQSAVNVAFTLSCQHPQLGGFAKHPGTFPDLLHTYMSFCGLGLVGVEGIKPIDPELCMSKDACSRILDMKQ